MMFLGLSVLRARFLRCFFHHPRASRGSRPRLESLEDRCCPSLTFLFDYSFDSSGFFNDPQRRAILNLAGQILGSHLYDSLTPITPSPGNTWTASIDNPATGVPVGLPNLDIPANTLLIYAAGRDYQGASVGEGGFGGESASGSSSWLDTVAARGQTGALGATPTNFAPWGGALSFDTTTSWSFGDASTPPGPQQYDFLSVALHELGHVLGIGTALSWQAHVWAGAFHGQAAEAEFGGPVPVDASAHHWATGTLDHGVEPDMTPSIQAGQRKLFTPLDWAALQDIGWQLQPSSSPPVPGQQTAGVFDPGSGQWYLRSALSSGPANAGSFGYGGPGWLPVAGDWDGNGTTTIGVVEPSTMTWYLRNSNSAGAPDVTPFPYGAVGWIPVVGDWTGTGHSGIGVFDPTTGTWYLRDTASPGPPDHTFVYGAPGWKPVTGDWSGEGHTGIGVFDPSTAIWFLRSSPTSGPPDIAPFAYGGAGWTPVVGDWNADGATTIGVIDPDTGTWYLRNSNDSGAPDLTPFAYGAPGWIPVAGKWEPPSSPRPADKAAVFLAAPVQASLRGQSVIGVPSLPLLTASPQGKEQPLLPRRSLTDPLDTIFAIALEDWKRKS
jgi:hypothetical protein